MEAFGERPGGNLTLAGPSTDFHLTWCRDPGASPDVYLDQILGTYTGGDVQVVSERRGTAPVGGGRVLDLVYRFGGHEARKTFAVWTSEGSDRVFFATMEGQPEDDLSTFEEILESFSELGPALASLEAREASGDPWQIVLQDTLSSYGYSAGTILPGTTIKTSSKLSVLPDGRLSSHDVLKVKLSEEMFLRSGAVLATLRNCGYEARLLQARGRAWVAVEDTEGRWQAVSINPTEPGRTIGVLVEGNGEGSVGGDAAWYGGVLYDDISEMAEDNGMKIGPSDYDELVVRLGDPPRQVALRPASGNDQVWIDGLREVLEGHEYPESYGVDSFDCSNTSQICWAILTTLGYRALLMMSYAGHPLDPHMWVAVRYEGEEGCYVAVEATTTDGSPNLIGLGRLVWEEEYYQGIAYNTSLQYSRLHPEEGMWLVAAPS